MECLNEKQKEQLKEIIEVYKYFFICNKCGSVYGTDFHREIRKICPICVKVELANKKNEKSYV